GSVTATPSGAVDANTPGNYTITYTANDGQGNSATKTRTVTVQDTTAPAITLTGANPILIECHGTFIDPGATATDACAGSVTAAPSGTVDANTPGNYTITYTANDGNGNTATKTRTLTV